MTPDGGALLATVQEIVLPCEFCDLFVISKIWVCLEIGYTVYPSLLAILLAN